MTDRNTISQVIESLFEDWIDKNINVHPLAVDNMRILEADALALLKEQGTVPVKEDKINKCECGETVCRYWHPKFCGFCGRELLWY